MTLPPAQSTSSFPANDSLALLRARSLLLTGQHQAAADLLASLRVLPAEGVIDARALFHEAFLLVAVERLQARAFDDALRLVGIARQWPENLGAGKPYPGDVDERLEDCSPPMPVRAKGAGRRRQALDKILAIPARAKGRGLAISSVPWPSSNPAAPPKPSNSSKPGRRKTPHRPGQLGRRILRWPPSALTATPEGP